MNAPETSAPLRTATPTCSTASAADHDVLLADEITRRLRRIGLNFNRARLPRPYDPAGELC